jgi:hypothetical protein
MGGERCIIEEFFTMEIGKTAKDKDKALKMGKIYIQLELILIKVLLV